MINKKYIQPIIIVVLLFVIFIQRSCNSNLPVIKYKDKLIVKYDTVNNPVELHYKTITKYKNLKGNTIYLPGKVDTVEVKVFEKAEDTIKTNMFSDAIKIRQYKNEFNDSLADISIFTETKGELLKISPTINIKARLPEKKTLFAIYLGGGMYINENFNLGYKLNLRFQNKKGNLISGGYDPVNKKIFAEYDFRLINIKK